MRTTIHDNLMSGKTPVYLTTLYGGDAKHIHLPDIHFTERKLRYLFSRRHVVSFPNYVQ